MTTPQIDRLIRIVRGGNGQQLRDYLSSGVNPNEEDRTGVTPLAAAAADASEEIVADLLRAGADPNYQPCIPPPLVSAARRGHERIVQVLLDAGALPDTSDDEGDTPLITASAGGYLSVVRALVQAGADVTCRNMEGATALLAAARNGRRAVAEHLMPISPAEDAAEARMVLDAQAASMHAAERLIHRQVRAAAGPIPLVHDPSVTPLMVACRAGDIVAVRSLISRGADIEAKDSHLARPLFYAAQAGRLEVVLELIRAGASALFRVLDGSSPLVAAARSGHADVVALLAPFSWAEDRLEAERLLSSKDEK